MCGGGVGKQRGSWTTSNSTASKNVRFNGAGVRPNGVIFRGSGRPSAADHGPGRVGSGPGVTPKNSALIDFRRRQNI